MEVTRKEMKFEHGGHEWVIQSLVPADFLGEDTWPFHFYRLKGEVNPSVMREWPYKDGIKPKWFGDQEAATHSRILQILKIGIAKPKFTDAEIEQIADDRKLCDLLVGVIFAVTYDVVGILHEGAPTVIEGRELSREHLEEIYIKSKLVGREPWEVVYGSGGESEGMNPRRHDFNTLALVVGFQRDARLSEQTRQKYLQ